MIVAGIDVGYGYTKAVTAGNTVSFPSVVGPADREYFQIDDRRLPDPRVVLDGKEYLCGSAALRRCRIVYDVRHRDFVGSLPHRALTLYALVLLDLRNQATERYFVVTGLPVSHYLRYREAFEAYSGTHTFFVNSHMKTVQLQIARVVPQPAGTLFDLMITDRGEVTEASFLRQRIGIIDIGYFTTDLALLDNLELVESRSSGVDVGMSVLLDNVAEMVAERFNRELSRREAEDVILTKKVRIFGEDHDASEIVHRALSDFTSFVGGFIANLWGRADDLDYMILTGGGAKLLTAALREKYPHLRAMLEPVFANARGFYKYALRLSKRLS